jgi:hypothetical protein
VLQQNVAGTSLVTPTLEKGKTYCFSVTAYNPAGSSPSVSQCFAVWPGYAGNWISASGVLVNLYVVTIQVSPYYSYPSLWGSISGLSCYSGATPLTSSTPLTGVGSAPSALTELPNISMVVRDGSSSFGPGPGILSGSLVIKPGADSQGFEISVSLSVYARASGCADSGAVTLHLVQ